MTGSTFAFYRLPKAADAALHAEALAHVERLHGPILGEPEIAEVGDSDDTWRVRVP